MDLCAVFLMVYLCKVSMSTSAKYQHIEVLETTTKFPSYLAAMGKSLTAIPRGDFNVKNINCGYNNINNLTPYVFSNNGFVNLERIQLSHNEISSVSSKAFRKLNELNMVDLSSNGVRLLDVNTFSTNEMLEKLDLTSNKIRFRDRPFLKSFSLATLILSDNRIEQIFEDNFAYLPNLRNLVLNSNVIFSIADYSFTPLGDLIYLSVAHTGVYRLSDEMFNGSYPKIIDVTDSPLASKFNPPLRKIKNKAVAELINIDKYY